MSGERERYQILMSPSAHRRYRKFDQHLQRKIKEEARKLSVDPYRYEELKGPLKGIRSYHFEYKNTQYRIAYRIVERESRIEVVLVKSRKGFYQILRRIIYKKNVK
jgi:addiction module RelE/StbE family toxin